MTSILHTAPSAPPDASPNAPLGVRLHELHRTLGALLGDGTRNAAWTTAVETLAGRTMALLDEDRDALLYLLGQDAQRALESYTSRHALFSAVVGLCCADAMAWATDDLQLFARAALTMNIGMTALHDELSFRDRTVTVEQREQIRTHPQRGAGLLRAAGWDEPDLLDVVERHHDESPAGTALGELSRAGRIAALLRRVDVFTAKVSARKTRPGMSPTAAARDACLGADGRPDELGMVVIKTLGMYPPGSYVKLVSGELAVVSRRGAMASKPRVLSLAGPDGRLMAEPIVRETAEPAHAIKAALRPIDSRTIALHLRAGALSG